MRAEGIDPVEHKRKAKTKTEGELTRLTLMLSLRVFVRSSELRFSRRCEFDLKRGLWEIPDTRPELQDVRHSRRGTKMAGDVNFVPLSPQVVALLEQIHTLTGTFDLVSAGDAKPWMRLQGVFKNPGRFTQPVRAPNSPRSIRFSAQLLSMGTALLSG